MSTNRFYIEKDLVEWAKNLPSPPWGDLSDSDEKSWKFHYNGDEDLKKFIHIYDKDIEKFQKFFPNMDIWLKNIFWSPLFASGEKIIKILSEKTSENTLAIVQISPLEMAIVGEVLGHLGVKNIVYNFNRAAAVNSKSKTLEATLFLVAWRYTAWLKKEVEQLAKNLENSIDKRKLASNIIFLDENNIPPKWNILNVDSYVKNAIGFKENTVTYRVDDLPTREFLLEKNIENIYFFDQDETAVIDGFFKSKMGDIFSIKKFSVPASESRNIGYYEDYVTSKNSQYLLHRKNILDKAQKTATHLSAGGLEKSTVATPEWHWNDYKKEKPLTTKEKIIASFSLGILFLLFLALVSTNPTPNNNTTSGGSNAISTWGGSSGGGGSWSSSSSSSSKNSFSSVSSFGGGGFSKGGSGG